MRIVITMLLIDILYLLIRFWCYYEKKDYFQTGFFVARLDRFHKKILQFLCGIITKHPPSATEWGYGGGNSADRWCRWCDKQYQVPKESVYFTNPESKNLMKGVTKDANSD